MHSLKWKIILAFVIVSLLSALLVHSVWHSWYVLDMENRANYYYELILAQDIDIERDQLADWMKFKLPVIYFLFALLVVAATLIAWYVWRDIYVPIEKTTLIVHRVTKGNYDYRIDLQRNDELFVLADAINQMIRSNSFKIMELADEKRKLEGVLNNMPSGVILANQDGRIAYVNPAAEKIFKIKAEFVIGNNIDKTISKVEIITHVEAALKRGEVYRSQIKIKNTEINERIVEVSVVPVKNVNRLITGVIIVMHDISELKKLEQMRADFVANVSHEIKTPITSIKGFAETMLDGAIDNRDIAIDFTEIIYKESGRLTNLVQDLLDLSNIEASKTVIEKQPDDIVAIINEVASDMRNELDKKKVKLSINNNRNIIIHDINRDRIKQVFINLFSNAIAYAREDATIQVRVYDNYNDIVIEVQDNGIGIPEEELQRVFERFYRVHKDRSRATGGTGLGLSIVKHIIDVHQGEIIAESKVGEGTTFRITLPKSD